MWSLTKAWPYLTSQKYTNQRLCISVPDLAYAYKDYRETKVKKSNLLIMENIMVIGTKYEKGHST